MPSNKEMFTIIVHTMCNEANHIGRIKKVIRNYIAEGFNINSRYVKGRNLCHYAVKYNEPALISFLVHLGLKIDLCDDNYDAPIHKAVRDNRYQMVKELIKNNADINISAEFEETPLHIAVSENNYVIAKLLIDNGADISLVDEHNHTPLDYAIDEHNESMIELLKNEQKLKRR